MEVNEFTALLEKDIQQLKSTVSNNFYELQEVDLNWKENEEKWSILECLEHLNRYHHYYFPLLQKAFSGKEQIQGPLKSGWIGKKFINMMKIDGSKKMKTLQHMNPQLTPSESQLDKRVIDEFLKNQDELLQLLVKAPKSKLNKRNIPVEFFKILKMKAGDGLLFLVEHEKRHIFQATCIKKELPQLH